MTEAPTITYLTAHRKCVCVDQAFLLVLSFGWQLFGEFRCEERRHNMFYAGAEVGRTQTAEVIPLQNAYIAYNCIYNWALPKAWRSSLLVIVV